jgi:sulfur carrier protein
VLNGEAVERDGQQSVAQLVDSLGQGRAGLAVAINGEVVPRSVWEQRPLRDDDRVEVLTAAQGG